MDKLPGDFNGFTTPSDRTYYSGTLISEDTNDELERQAFERYLTDIHLFTPNELVWEERRNCYAIYGVHLAWSAWRARARQESNDG